MKQNLITDVVQEMLPYLNNAQMEKLQEALVYTLFKYEVTKSEKEKEESSSTIIPDVLEYINSHFCEKLTLTSIADEFFVSKYYLSHVFNNVVGTSVHRYIMLKRLIHAKQMLLSGIKSTTAATNCGFNDYAGFYRAFTAEYGVTPKEFVKKNR